MDSKQQQGQGKAGGRTEQRGLLAAQSPRYTGVHGRTHRPRGTGQRKGSSQQSRIMEAGWPANGSRLATPNHWAAGSRAMPRGG
jgi:hypothetical protein